MSKKRDQLESLVKQVLEEFSSELYLLRWEKRGDEWILEVLLEKEGPVTTSDCAEVSKKISSKLDERDLIDREYFLQVSSPGVERPLTEHRDFDGAIGGGVEINTYGPIEGAKNFVVLLKSFNGETEELELEVDGKTVTIPLNNVSKATAKDINSEV